ncbi:MAG: hypothetical protein M0Z79_07600 [Nitrospiraceae bacterium]|nr:hypothetical protein [Nitrospiraceae bacterium]
MKKIGTLMGAAILASFLTVGVPLMTTHDSSDCTVKTADAAEAPSTDFAWHPNRPGIKRAQIALGRASTLRFEFSLKGKNGTQVKFGLPKKYVTMGIKIDPNEVSVSEEKASSKAVLTVPPGMPLGKFDIPVIAVDSKTGAELGRGEIPIMLLPAGVGGC